MEVFIVRSARIILVLLLLVTIGIRNGEIFGFSLFSSADSSKKAAAVEIEDIKGVFKNADSYVKVSDNTFDVYSGSLRLGKAISSSPLSDSIVGYTSSVPVLIGVNSYGKVSGVHLLKNYESTDFVAKIKKSGYLNQWNGKSYSDALNVKPDAFSGATMTSTAIIATVKSTLARQSNEAVGNDSAINYFRLAGILLAFILLGCALLMFFYPARFKRFRVPVQLVTIGVLGFWLGESISVYTSFSWLVHGISIVNKIFAAVLFLLAIVLPLLTKKAFYCTYVCPFGAAQELIGKIGVKKIKIPQRMLKYLSSLREFIFGALVFLLLIGVVFDLTYIEPFSAFAFKTASLPVIILAVGFLVLSLFIPRAWCRFFCPTGQLLEVARRVLIVK